MGLLSRRNLLVASGTLAATAMAASPCADAAPTEPRKWKVLVAGGHPGDPEAACGGSIARYADQGHDVAALYLTRGEAGIAGKSHAEAAAIRFAEANRACDILKARSIFAEQIDGSLDSNVESLGADGRELDAGGNARGNRHLICIDDGVGEPPYPCDNRDRTVAQRAKLGESTGLEARRDQ